MTELGSVPVPLPRPKTTPGPSNAALVIEYADSSARTARSSARQLREPVRRVFPHFPVRSSHPRAWPAACAAEAAARQGRFWEMHDLLFADQGRLEDPHLWQRARVLGLDLERFDADRRDESVLARVQQRFSRRRPRRGGADADGVHRRTGSCGQGGDRRGQSALRPLMPCV